MRTIAYYILVACGILSISVVHGQQIPDKLDSYPIFAPEIINPGYCGSKDLSLLHLISNTSTDESSQLISYNSRIRDRKNNYSIPDINSYSNLGIGTYFYHEKQDLFRSLGFAISGAYHIPVGKNKTSGISLGITAKGVYNIGTPDSEGNVIANSFHPASDIGLFYYGPNGYIGISSANITSLFIDAGDLQTPMENEQILMAGYKLVLSKEKAVVIEPSILLYYNDNTTSNPIDEFYPSLKIYIQNACIGALYREKTVLFLQYQFPKLFTGIMVELPGNEIIIDRNQLSIELSLGLKLNDFHFEKTSYHW